jgi:hypothetical protein
VDVSNERLVDLVAAADHAYQRAREQVFDKLPCGSAIDPSHLTSTQLSAFDGLVVAETQLADYRRERLVPDRERELVGAWSFR